MQSELGKNFIWQGREDTEDGEKGLRWHQVINTGEKQQNPGMKQEVLAVGM